MKSVFDTGFLCSRSSYTSTVKERNANLSTPAPGARATAAHFRVIAVYIKSAKMDFFTLSSQVRSEELIHEQHTAPHQSSPEKIYFLNTKQA
jgi:hypothetical protein